MTAPASPSAMVTDWAELYVALAGFTVGAGGAVVSGSPLEPSGLELIVRMSWGWLLRVASLEESPTPSLDSGESSKETAPAVVMPVTGVLTRATAMPV